MKRRVRAHNMSFSPDNREHRRRQHNIDQTPVDISPDNKELNMQQRRGDYDFQQTSVDSIPAKLFVLLFICWSGHIESFIEQT